MTLLVLVGPSGVGKTLLGNRLLDELPAASWVRTYTTRQIRPEEQARSGRVSLLPEEFDAVSFAGAFAWQTYQYGESYGTSMEDIAVAPIVNSIIYMLDFSPTEIHHTSGVTGFVHHLLILPPSKEALLSRLVNSGRTDRIDEALKNFEYAETLANSSWASKSENSVIINDDIAITAVQALKIIHDRKLRRPL
ncbi:hypothetical protein [Mycobacterium sp. OAE908]|uniref:hypothetical protein n=1 Tax=Mycobacterium sp. OAE908 TaxID=2817899 RepID=UPI001AE0FFC2